RRAALPCPAATSSARTLAAKSEHELDAVGHAQLLVHVVQMKFGRPRGNAQARGNVPVPKTPRDELSELDLAWGQAKAGHRGFGRPFGRGHTRAQKTRPICSPMDAV